jgi:ubiquinone/menaquinone biosynthesis C-methylase UbiE
MSTDGPDLQLITQRQRGVWSAGDFNRVAVSIMEVAEQLVASADPRPGSRVLDVACGSGNAALVAARRFCEVTGVDFAPNLLERARVRAEAEGTPAQFVEGDAQELPVPDGAFETVTSVFGVMFAPDQERAAAELLRACAPGGTIALANWIPGSFAPAMFGAVAPFAPPPPGLPPPWRWGTPEGAEELLGSGASVRTQVRTFYQRFPSRPFMDDLFRRYFGPTMMAYEAVPEEQQPAMTAALADAVAAFDRADDGTCKLECRYLEVIATRNR